MKSLDCENTEITSQDGCLLKGTRVVIGPEKLKTENVLNEIHTGCGENEISGSVLSLLAEH